MIPSVGQRPTGPVTFLFTDIEGSTQMWEHHTSAMEAALSLHDDVVRRAIEGRDGYVFSLAGDAFAAAFSSAEDAVGAARDAQADLASADWPDGARIRVRMGLHTGVASERDGQYFGPNVNRAARIMSAGHGGQILLSSTTAALVDGNAVVYVAECRLKDLSEPVRIFQIDQPHLEFAPLRTLDSTPGNLPVLATSFVGRESEVEEVAALVRLHRLVTLIGVAGVGKTRLALQVAAEVNHEFPDGVWLIELAPVSDPAAVPDVFAAALGVTVKPGLSVTESIARALSGRELLVVLDNCEHVLDAAAGVVDAVLTRASTPSFLATSREGLRVPAEHAWPVPTLSVASGVDSAAVQLFTERAQAVNPAFHVDEVLDSVMEICARLDGIALAIELAAARTVSMTARDIRDRLDDRFRLLAGTRRGLERHQTLRDAVRWSYDLLDHDEQSLLVRCSVFARGFDLRAATHVGGRTDEFDVLDLLDSLVRKSLITVEESRGRGRYGMLETIRRFAEDQLVASDRVREVRDAHASFFAHEAERHWEIWDGPRYRESVDWFETELDNLRAAFRSAVERGDLDVATTVAAHAAMLGQSLQTFEPVGWCEELVAAATDGRVRQLPRLCAGASLCLFQGRPNDSLAYAHQAVALETEDGYDPFLHGVSRFREANAHHFMGDLDTALEIFSELAAQPGPAHVRGACGQASVLIGLGRDEEAISIVEDALAAAHRLGNPYWVATALGILGRATEASDPTRAMETFERGLAIAIDERLRFVRPVLMVSAAPVVAVHGDPARALGFYADALEAMHRSGEIADAANMALVFASLASTFDRLGRHVAAATLCGVIHRYSSQALEVSGDLFQRLRAALGESEFDRRVTLGSAMELGEAVRFVRAELVDARNELASCPG
jgi:predicted ATPase/class 3 adenylate cyclase